MLEEAGPQASAPVAQSHIAKLRVLLVNCPLRSLQFLSCLVEHCERRVLLQARQEGAGASLTWVR